MILQLDFSPLASILRGLHPRRTTAFGTIATMLFHKPVAILLLSLIPSIVATHPLEVADDTSNSFHADTTSLPNENAVERRQVDQKLWIGYQATFLWSAAIISTTTPLAPILDMKQFYANVRAKAESDMNGYSAQNQGKQPQGTWEYYQTNCS